MPYQAAMDIGSNSVKTTVVLADGPLQKIVAKRSKVTRLGQGFAEGRLQDEPMERTIAAMREQLDWLAGDYAPCKVVIGATSAVRDAENGLDFLERCKRSLRLAEPPYRLSGEQEAFCTFMGAGCAVKPGDFLVNADPGGGSTEISYGLAGERLMAFRSFPVGAVRWGERFDLEGPSTPQARETALKAAEGCFDGFIKDGCFGNRVVPSLSISGGSAFMVGSLAAGHLIKPPEFATPVGEEVIAGLIEQLGPMDIETRKQVPGMPDDRANVAVSALIIILGILHTLNYHSFTPNPYGLRQGLLIGLRQGIFQPSL